MKLCVERGFDRLRKHMTDLTIIFIFWSMSYNLWKNTTSLNDKFIEVLQYQPHSYRLWTQFLILLDQYPIAFVALVPIVFASVATILYLLCHVQDRPILAAFFILVLWGSSMLWGSSFRQAPAYLILALAILLKDRDWSLLMVVPMTIVKEHAGMVYVIYLISAKKYREAILAGILWALTYTLIRFIVGPRDWYLSEDPAYVVSPPILTLDPYILRLGPAYWSNWVILAGDIGLTLILVRDRKEAFVFIANIPIITVFGLVYESQLWLMPAVAVIFSRRRTESD